jgi:hypothetical protein
MYLHFKDENNFESFETIPERIYLPNGMTRTSLNELSDAEQQALGLYFYEDKTPVYDQKYYQLTGEITYNHTDRTFVRVVAQIPLETLKEQKLAELLSQLQVEAAAGLVCSNGIKLQVEDQDLVRWTQLSVSMLAFQPQQCSVRDYNNVVHVISLQEAQTMMAEVAAWAQAHLAKVWQVKDGVRNATTLDELNAVTLT